MRKEKQKVDTTSEVSHFLLELPILLIFILMIVVGIANEFPNIFK